MLIKRLKIYLVVLVLFGSAPRISCFIGCEQLETSLETMNSYLQNLTQSLVEYRQMYQLHMEELRRNMKSPENHETRELSTHPGTLPSLVEKTTDNLSVINFYSTTDGVMITELQHINEKREETTQTCFDFRNSPSGIYQQILRNEFEAFCDNDYSTGGWTVIQNRFNGSVDFNRGWKAYQEGFGDLEGEFWLGLEKIHQLTSSKQHELHVVLEDFEGNSKVATYDDFRLADEAERYKLKSVGRYNGTAGDELTHLLGQVFNTFDADNDSAANFKCTKWWYSYNCGYSNLNGNYLGQGAELDCKGMYWYYFHNSCYSLKSSRMMIRAKV
ncbi:microfibril-associated glycoprotein 4-like [Uranotaenia lowii]|uniref:microfibril-associated glycoprotein 4-like n=1 Tax=Uranotaenia lowii TaxID=190385 RepID=UPI00247A549D|nr:microfibril-associated glycoprotein 4-like [Uranotaenia lowii]